LTKLKEKMCEKRTGNAVKFNYPEQSRKEKKSLLILGMKNEDNKSNRSHPCMKSAGG